MKQAEIKALMQKRGYAEEHVGQSYIFKRFVKRHVDELTDQEVELRCCVNEIGSTYILLAEHGQFQIRTDLLQLDEPGFASKYEKPLIAILHNLENMKNGHID